jgi:hypothetical protein
MAAEGAREKAVQASEIPGAGGDYAARVHPEVRVKAREAVAAGEVGSENRDRVKRSRRGTGHDDDIALEKTIGFVGRKVIGKLVRGTGGRAPEDTFARGPERRVVVVHQLAQTVEREEPAESESQEKKIVVGPRSEGERKPEEVLRSERELARGRCTALPEAPLQSFSDRGETARLADGGERRGKLAADAREIGSNRARLDMIGHVNDEVAKRDLGRVIREPVKVAESQVGLEVRAVDRASRAVKSEAESASTFERETLERPRQARGLTRAGRVCQHPPDDPSVGCGGGRCPGCSGGGWNEKS